MANPAVPAKVDPAALAFEVALGYFSPQELQLRFGVAPEVLRALREDERFKRAVLAYRREIDETGTQFKVKARKLASIVLDDLGVIALDPTVDTMDRIQAIRDLARYAGYAKDEAPQAANNAFAIQINLSQAGS